VAGGLEEKMGDAIGQILPTAVGIAISPFPIVAVVLMLVTARGRVNGPAFTLGWVIGLASVGAILFWVARRADSSGRDESTEVSVVMLVLGVLLLVAALSQWRARPRKQREVATPRWMRALDQFSPVKAAGAGVVLSALNPKNLVLAVAGAAAIAQTGSSTSHQVLAYGVFVLIATAGVGAPVLIYFAMGDRSRELLDRLKNWMARNSALIMAVLLLIIGVNLIGDGISALLG
jgi:threonine/homoserine/homoserine lactone efflux protein